MTDFARNDGERRPEDVKAPAGEDNAGREARTNQVISEMLGALTGENGYEAAMNGMLAMMASIVRPKRLSIWESGGREAKNTFEWCAPGVKPMVGQVQLLPIEIMKSWFKRFVGKTSVVLVPDVKRLKAVNEGLYEWCVSMGIECLMAAPFFSDGEMVGFLAAYNYELDNDEVDLDKVFSAVSSFIGARMDNRRLIDNLDWTGKHDALTKLLNRRGVDLALEELLGDGGDSAGSEPYTVVLIDLDDFKRINDLLGHAAGDEALLAVTRALIEAFPENAILSRNGGDEFLVVLPGTDGESSDALVSKFAAPGIDFEYDGVQRHMTLSVGYACFPEHASDYRELYKKADMALYAVKLAGKAGSMRYSAEVDMRHRSQLAFFPHDLVENVPCGIVVHTIGDKGAILHASDEFVHMAGYDSTAEFMDRFGGKVWNNVHPDDRIRVRDELIAFAARNEAGAEMSAEFRILTKSGESKRVVGRSRLVYIEELGKVYYTVLVAVE